MALQKDTDGYVYGTCDAKPCAVQLTQNDRGLPKVRVEMQVVGGEHDGKRYPYEPSLKPEQIKWGKAGLKALGWKGQTLRTLEADILKTPMAVSIEIRVASYDKGDGSPLRRWSSVDRIAGAMPVTEMGADALAKADSWFAEADDVGGGSESNGAKPTLPNDGLPF